jgi:hypothetical protein
MSFIITFMSQECRNSEIICTFAPDVELIASVHYLYIAIWQNEEESIYTFVSKASSCIGLQDCERRASACSDDVFFLLDSFLLVLTFEKAKKFWLFAHLFVPLQPIYNS